MNTSSQDGPAPFTFSEYDYANGTYDLTHEGGLDMNTLDNDGVQMPSTDFATFLSTPPPTDSTDSQEWTDFQEDAYSPTESVSIQSPVITFVRTDRKERRKAQNREAQRAYRSRKDEQMKALKQELVDVSEQLKTVTEAYDSAVVENALLTGAVRELRERMARKG